jgi:ABC transporter substrate binding protein
LEARVSQPKTKPTEVSAESPIAAIAKEERRNDAQTLLALMRRVTKQEPRMWGPSLVGFGSYHYKYASGYQGDSALAGFAVRGSELVVYIEASFEGRDVLLLSYGYRNAEMIRAAATYVDKILKGANAGDLPLTIWDRYYLTVNAKAASEFDLTLPTAFLSQADEVVK